MNQFLSQHRRHLHWVAHYHVNNQLVDIHGRQAYVYVLGAIFDELWSIGRFPPGNYRLSPRRQWHRQLCRWLLNYRTPQTPEVIRQTCPYWSRYYCYSGIRALACIISAHWHRRSLLLLRSWFLIGRVLFNAIRDSSTSDNTLYRLHIEGRDRLHNQ